MGMMTMTSRLTRCVVHAVVAAIPSLWYTTLIEKAEGSLHKIWKPVDSSLILTRLLAQKQDCLRPSGPLGCLDQSFCPSELFCNTRRSCCLDLPESTLYATFASLEKIKKKK